MLSSSSFFPVCLFLSEGGEGGVLTGLKVEKRHAEYRREKGAREKERAEQGNRLHGGAVALAGVGDAALLSGDFKIETGLSLRHDVVKLYTHTSC